MGVYTYDYNNVRSLKCIAHRGYSTSAPENTLPAYEEAYEHGFKFVETDVSFTSDNVAVLLHDSTIDRTSDGTGKISELTFAEVRSYDFGSWKAEKYAGVKIPTVQEFLQLCALRQLHPYIELKNNGGYTQSQIESVVDMVQAIGIEVTYISFASKFLTYIKNYDPYARLGFVLNGPNETSIATANGLKTLTNNVFIDGSNRTADAITICKSSNIPYEMWTFGTPSETLNLDPYVSGVTMNGGDPPNILNTMETLGYNAEKLAFVRDVNGHIL